MKKRFLSILLAALMIVSLLPVTALATDSTAYPITDGTTDTNGSISFNKTTAAEGETVTVTVNPADGYQLKSLTVLSALSFAPPIPPAQDVQDKTKYTFSMPDYPVRVTAVFEEKAITIADILPDDFPTFSWPLPDNVWKNSVGSKMYINNKGLTFGGVNLYNILTASVTKVENGYQYTSSPYAITFVMDSDKLVKVITAGTGNADNYGEYIPTHTHNDITFTAWTSSNSLPTATNLTDGVGSFYLTEDVTLTGTWNVPAGTTNLCLNGCVIKMTGNVSVITVGSGATLNLYDCGTTKHYFTVADNGLWTLDETNGTQTITGGVITGGGAGNGGGVNVDKGILNMNGGNIVGNTANTAGGGVYVNKGTLTMTKGEIAGNTAKKGGGVYVYSKNASFSMTDGSITRNKAEGNGGGVCVATNASFSMTGGSIIDNTAYANGSGGVFFNGAALTLGGTAQITGNKITGSDPVTETANNLYLYESKTVALGNGANAPAKGMLIGVTTQTAPTKETPVAITSNGSISDAAYFASDVEGFEAKFNSNHLELAAIQYQIWLFANGVTFSGYGDAPVPNVGVLGETIDFVLTPPSGQQIKTVTVAEDDGTPVEVAEYSDHYSFMMPASDVTITAELKSVSHGGGGSTPTVTVPVSGDKDSVKVTAMVSGSTATVKEIKDADLAKVTGGESVEIDLTGLKKDIDAAKIPTATVEKIGEQAGMSVKLTTATVAFDKTATQEISDQAKGNTVELVVDDIKEVSLNAVQKEAVQKLDTALIIDAYLVSGGTKLCTEGKGGFNGGKATVMLPYEIKNNRSAANYNVFYVDDTGKLEKLAAKYDVKLGAFVFDITHFSNYVVAYDENTCPQDNTCIYAKFTDANTKAWYHDGVHYCVENGMMNGVSDTQFAPNGTLTRGMVVTVLARLDGVTITSTGSEWYADGQAWAVKNGISDGTNMTANITREELATMLYRYALLKKVDVDEITKDTNTLSHNDVFTISDWATSGMHFCIAAGVVNGDDKGNLNPHNTATRAEAAAMFQRFCEKVIK